MMLSILDKPYLTSDTSYADYVLALPLG